MRRSSSVVKHAKPERLYRRGWIYIYGQPINSTWFDVCFGQFPTCLEPVDYAGFMLKPNRFFDANPAHDLPVEKNARSVDERAAAGTNGCRH